MEPTIGHDLRIEPALVWDEAHATCLPAAQLICTCGFACPPIADADLLNEIASNHLQCAAEIAAARRREE